MNSLPALSRSLLVALFALGATVTVPARADNHEIRIAKQYGLGYLPLIVIEHDKPIEQHPTARGSRHHESREVNTGGGTFAHH